MAANSEPGTYSRTGTGVPHAIHHVGIPVRDMEVSLAWYREALGVEPEFIETSEGPEVSQTVQLENVKLRFAFLALGNAVIELLEYERPIGQDVKVRNCDVGALHICLQVDDIDAAYRRLKRLGARFSIEPVTLAGALEGHRCCYFKGPDNVQFELWQTPAGSVPR